MKEFIDALGQINEQLGEIRESQVRQEEKQIDLGRRLVHVEEEVEPIQAHVQQMRGAGKLVAIFATLVTVVGVIYAVIR